jgi:hypothetical protein
MPGVVNTTNTFSDNAVITSASLNNIIDQTFFTSDAIVAGNTTLALVGDRLKVGTITSNEMGPSAVTLNAIADGAITNAKINASAAIDLSKLATGALPAAITIASANIVDGTIITADIADAAITAPKLDGAQTGTAPIYGVRAWVNFNAQSTANIGGTYTRTASTTVTVDTSSDHGLIVGNAVYLDFTVGTGTAPFDGLYVVASVVDSNTFTVVSSTTTTSSGTISLSRKTIRASGNVGNVSAAYSGATIASPPASSQAVDAGFHVVNFTTAMPDANAVISGVCNQSGNLDTSSGNEFLGGFTPNEKCAFISTVDVGSSARDCLHTSVQVIR